MSGKSVQPGGWQDLLIAIVQSQDADVAHSALRKVGISCTSLPSVGGFLGRRNTTLLIDISQGQKGTVETILKECCRQRLEYLAVPLESAPLPLPTPTPVNVGGATVFSVHVDYFEEV